MPTGPGRYPGVSCALVSSQYTHRVNTIYGSGVHPLLSLALLEAVQGLDEPTPDEFQEYHEDLSTKRLGMSRTVAVQIDRLAALARSRGRVAAEELIALLRLIGRRHDAELVFSDAGRRAGRHAVNRAGRRIPGLLHVLPQALRNRAGFTLAQRTARTVFGATLRRADGIADATVEDAPSARATESGMACAFYGAGLAEMLRLLTDFDGALFHVACRTRGERACVWRAAPEPGCEEEAAA